MYAARRAIGAYAQVGIETSVVDANPHRLIAMLFEGARGSRRGAGDWEISFNFAASPNVTGLTIGNITGINKKGWEYLWCRYADFEDAAAQMLVKRPVAVIVNRVYPSGNFSLLGIGS